MVSYPDKRNTRIITVKFFKFSFLPFYFFSGIFEGRFVDLEYNKNVVTKVNLASFEHLNFRFGNSYFFSGYRLDSL